MVYIPISQRKETEQLARGYIPISERLDIEEEKPLKAGLDIDLSAQVQTSTPAISSNIFQVEAPSPEERKSFFEIAKQKFASEPESLKKEARTKLVQEAEDAAKTAEGGFFIEGVRDTLKGFGQSIARSFLATGAGIAAQPVGEKDIKKRFEAFTQAKFTPDTEFLKGLTGVEEPFSIQSIGEGFLEDFGASKDTAKKYGTVTGLFIAGLDVVPLGGPKGAFKALKEANTVGDAMGVLIKMGADEDLARFFADDVVRVKTDQEAKLLLDAIGEQQALIKAAGPPKGDVIDDILDGHIKMRPPSSDVKTDYRESLGKGTYMRIFSGGKNAISPDEVARSFDMTEEELKNSLVDRLFERREGAIRTRGGPKVPVEQPLIKEVPELVPEPAFKAAPKAPKEAFSDDFYQRAIEFSAGQKVAPTLAEKAKGVGGDAIQLIQKKAEPISTTLANIDIILKDAIRKFEGEVRIPRAQYEEQLKPLFQKAAEARRSSPEDFIIIDLAMKNADVSTVEKVASKIGMLDDIKKFRALDDELYDEGIKAGYKPNYLRGHFPRFLKDPKGLAAYIAKNDPGGVFSQAIRIKEKQIGRNLTDEEKAYFIDSLIRNAPDPTIAKTKGKLFQERAIDIITPEINQFYEDSFTAITRYIQNATEAIASRKFFGKAAVIDKESGVLKIEESIGQYIMNLLKEGKITPDQEKTLSGALKARFQPKDPSKFVGGTQKVAYIVTLGNPIQAMTQIQDLTFSLYEAGARPERAFKEYLKSLFGLSEIKAKDLGLQWSEMEFNTQKGISSFMTKVLRHVGFQKLDRMGTESLINVYLGNIRREAAAPSKKFLDEINRIFGDEAPQVIDDLKNNVNSENVKMMLLSRVLDFKPAALSEMPVGYLTGGNGRVFYTLKTYRIKLIDVFRNEALKEIKSGNKAQGLKNLVSLATYLTALGMAVDEAKDLILGRETDLSDRVIDNVLKTAALSKYMIYKARREGPVAAIEEFILPPFNIIDKAFKDVVDTATGKLENVTEAESIQYIPYGGKLYYWWFGKGATKEEARQRKESGLKGAGGEELSTLLKQSGLPPLPSLPQLPTLPPLPELP